MNVTETLSDGLKRELAVVIPAAEIDAKLAAYMDDLRGRVRINGFRPGKVPVGHLRRLYGRQAMTEIVNEAVTESVRQAVAERNEKPALQPAVEIPDDKLEAILSGGTDLAFSMRYEVLPEIVVGDIKSIKIERPVAEVTEEEVDAEVANIAKSVRPFEPKEGPAAEGDRVTIDFLGKLDGEPFEGGGAEDFDLEIGSNRFIPGFEPQLVGLSAGEEKVITVTFPEDYGAANLAGKEATFDIKVKAVAAPAEVTLDDAFAQRFGLESLDKLKEAVREQISGRYAAASRQKVKRALLDALDETHKFEVPELLLETEVDGIWRQLQADMARSGRTFEDEDTTEEEARAEYRRIAERRVRLGLVLSHVGEVNNIEVSEEEVQRALQDELRRYPGREREIIDYYRKNQGAVAALRAPIYEDKVVDYLLELATVDTKTVSKDELFAEAEEDEAAAA